MKKTITIDGKAYCYDRQEKKIDTLDLISFLKRQDCFPKMYWNERFSDEERVAIGSLVTLNEIPDNFDADPEVRLYGGCAFSDKADKNKIWKDFPHRFFFLPQFEIVQTKEQTQLITHHINGNSACCPLRCDYQKTEDETLPAIIERKDTPTKELWDLSIDKCLKEIQEDSFTKVVLARQTKIKFQSTIDPYILLRHLKENKLNTTIFCLHMGPTMSFMGSTPEKLYTKNKSSLYTEALAGTLPRGITQEEDLKFQDLLMKGPKEQQEVAKVELFLESALCKMGKQVKLDSNYSIFQTPKVQHLYKKLSCMIDDAISHKEIFQSLHPTPAVGGSPRNEALVFIKENEPFDRGWYAGAIGWISSCSADLAVGIRSALISHNFLHLFAGTGIVPGSDPLKEWQELENKISQFTELFHVQ